MLWTSSSQLRNTNVRFYVGLLSHGSSLLLNHATPLVQEEKNPSLTYACFLVIVPLYEWSGTVLFLKSMVIVLSEVWRGEIYLSRFWFKKGSHYSEFILSNIGCFIFNVAHPLWLLLQKWKCFPGFVYYTGISSVWVVDALICKHFGSKPCK